jgi:hypothetical protein
MIWVPFRRAWHNPIFRGGLEEFSRHSIRWSHAVNYLIVLSIVLFITWPKEQFLSLRDLPFTYNALGGAMIIVLAYLSFSYGARKGLGASYVSVRDWLTLAPIGAGVFLRGYVAVGLVELLFFWGLSLPLLVAAAGVAGESLPHLGAGMLIILVCTGTYRLMGIALLTVLERDEFLLYIIVRLLYVFFVLVSGFVMPLGNPVLAFTDASIRPQELGMLRLLGVTVHGWGATVVLHLLLAAGAFIIATLRVHWMQRRTATPGENERSVAGG